MSPPNIPQTQSRTKIHELSDFELAEFKQAFEEFDKVKKYPLNLNNQKVPKILINNQGGTGHKFFVDNVNFCLFELPKSKNMNLIFLIH